METTNKTSRQLQADKTRKHILDTAYQLICEKPVAAIRITDITKASGISTGTFYHYFPSKEDLFARLALDPTALELNELRSTSELPLMERLKIYCQICTSILEKQGMDMLRNLQQFRMTAQYREIRNQMYEGHFEYEVLHSLFLDAIESGELKENFPTDFYANLIVYDLYGLTFNHSLYDDPFEPTKWYPQYLDFLEHTALAPYWNRA